MVMTSYSDWNEIMSGTLFEIASIWSLGVRKNEYPKEDKFWADVNAVRKCPLQVCLMMKG